MLVEVHDQGHGRPVGPALAVGQDLGHIEELQSADQGRDHHVEEDGPQDGKRDPEEDLSRVGPVHLRRLVQGLVDPQHAGQQQDRRVSEPHQEIHACHKGSGAEGVGQELVGGAENADLQQHGVDRAGVRKQGKEEHGEGGGHDQVGHVDDGLEELPAPEPQRGIREPGGQEQGDNDLGDKSHDPHDHRVLEILADVT